jgi:hypothetical protein
VNTLSRKAWGNLTRPRTRTLLAADTLAIAITSLGLLAAPGLLNAAMHHQVQQSQLNDLAIPTRVLDLTFAQLGALRRLPGTAQITQSAPTSALIHIYRATGNREATCGSGCWGPCK